MDNELDDVARSLFNGILPMAWRSKAPATKKSLGSWMTQFFERNKQYSSWVGLIKPKITGPRIDLKISRVRKSHWLFG